MNPPDSLTYDVVVTGGGFAGVYAAQALGNKLGRDRVAIIADQNFMVFQPMLAEVAGSSISPRHVVNPIRRLCQDVTVLRGSVTRIDLPESHLTMHAGKFTGPLRVQFDHLALALGSIVDLSRVPGMPEHAYILRNVGDALELRSTIIDRCEEANLQSDPAAIRRLLTFVVVGGGYSGVEVAGQILDLLQGIRRFYPRLAQPQHRVVLVHSRDVLLPEISAKLGRYSEENLRARGVEVLLGTRVTSMTSSKVYLGDDREIDTHTVISTVGNAPHPLITQLCHDGHIECERGRVLTDDHLLVKGQTKLWAAGDCAVTPMKGGGTCPPNAQFAQRQGTLMGKNIARKLRDQPTEPFTFTGLGELASIGHRAAVADIMGYQFHGFIAWFMWRTIYLAKLPGLERKIRVMLDWTLDLFFPRDIVLLRSQPTDILQEMYLAPGDQVFNIGEPALSLYIVKSGRIELGDEQGVVRSLGPGEHFGERALLHDKVWRYRATAAEPSILVVLGGDAFDAIASASQSIHKFFEHSADRYLSAQQIESLVGTLPPALREQTAGDVMTHEVVSLSADATVAEALSLFQKHGYASCPLLDAEKKPQGWIERDDLLDALKRTTLDTTAPLEKCPRTPCSTVRPGTPIPELVERLARGGDRKLLVTDENGATLGLVTLIDLLANKGPGKSDR